MVRETETGSSAGHTQGESTWVRTPDGRELHAMVLPGPDQAQAPTIVFESGAAVNRSLWALVQPLVGEWAWAIVYDRSGYGRSAPDPHSCSRSRPCGRSPSSSARISTNWPNTGTAHRIRAIFRSP